MKYNWKPRNTGWALYLGTVKVAYVDWNQFKAKGEEGVDYVAHFSLPGISKDAASRKGPDMASLKTYMEDMLDMWLTMTNLKRV